MRRLAKINSAILLAIGGLGGAQSAAGAEAKLQLDLPRAEPRPYVAVWLERATDHGFVGNIAVWFDTAKRGNRGARWLQDLRQWWRSSGGVKSLPVDGVTGATRAAGVHTIDLAAGHAFSKLPAGDYEVLVEIAREHGGRDVLRLPLSWPPSAAKTETAQGREEIKAARLTTAP